MSTKDYVYLGLVAFSAIVFYLHGWYAGVQARPDRKQKRVDPRPAVDVSVFVTTLDSITTEVGSRSGVARSRCRVAETPVHCFFGNN